MLAPSKLTELSRTSPRTLRHAETEPARRDLPLQARDARCAYLGDREWKSWTPSAQSLTPSLRERFSPRARPQAYLGSYKKVEDAVFAHDICALALRGDAAKLNAPREEYDMYLPFIKTLHKKQCVQLVKTKAFKEEASKYFVRSMKLAFAAQTGLSTYDTAELCDRDIRVELCV